MTRSVLLVTHPGRAETRAAAAEVVERLAAAHMEVRVADDRMQLPGRTVVVEGDGAAVGCELVVVLGGDGTILRAAEYARPAAVPLLGVNLGRVGFLAEAERDDLAVTVDRIVERAYDVEERLTLDACVRVDGSVIAHDWALNDASVEKASRERMLEVVVEVDGRPLSRFGCDGVVFSTPTGSTAYAFSAGGPVVWPSVEALLLVPISAHALFARPLVVSPDSVLAVEVQKANEGAGVLWCDGRRSDELPPGARIEVRRGALPVRLARLQHARFTDRLVRKFRLPIAGWRGAHDSEAPDSGAHDSGAHDSGASGPEPTAGPPGIPADAVGGAP
jgi:NAD+ kinase